MIQNRFEDQCAGVTGGGSGIGTAIARRILEACFKSKVPMGWFCTSVETALMMCRLVAKVAGFWTGSVFDQLGGRATC